MPDVIIQADNIVSSTPPPVVDLDKPAEKAEKPAEPKVNAKPTEQPKAEDKPAETDKKEQPDSGYTQLMKKLEDSNKAIAKLQADNAELLKTLENKKIVIDKSYQKAELEKKSKEEILNKYTELLDKDQKREAANQELYNRWESELPETAKSLLKVAGEGKSVEEKFKLVADAQAAGLLSPASSVSKVDHSFAARVPKPAVSKNLNEQLTKGRVALGRLIKREEPRK